MKKFLVTTLVLGALALVFPARLATAQVNGDPPSFSHTPLTGPGVLTSLSASTLARSGYLELFGSNFGVGGQVRMDGISAPVSDWTDTHIVAYVPEAASLASVPVDVVNSSGLASNFLNLAVTARAPDGLVRWRFRMDGPYSQVRPVIAPDGTVYTIDVFSHLYALTPDGGLKWLVNGAGTKGVAVGADGSIYVGAEDAIRAFNPDGTAKWTFVENPYAFIFLGLSVGPDGNIYGVATEGIGVFSLTPAGTLRWQVPEPYNRIIVDYGEILFGPNGSSQQLYFYANDHLRALKLDGSSVFSTTNGGTPAVGPDGNVHVVLGAFSPAGTLLWQFSSPYPYNVLSPPDVGSDGIHYFVQNLSQAFALNPGGTQKWNVLLNGYAKGPIVDPLNTKLVMGSSNTLDMAGFVLAVSAADGHELWRVVLPAEDGFNQYVDTRARFSPDGLTAYIVTATATGDNDTSKSFVYALDAGGVAPLSTMRSTSITLASGKIKAGQVTVTGTVTVKDVSNVPVGGATTLIKWKLPNGSTQTQSVATNSSGKAVFTIKSGRGKYTLTITNITKTGWTFDKVNSVMTKSATF